MRQSKSLQDYLRRKNFEKIVLSVIEDLPAKFRQKMENVQVVIEDNPAGEILERQGIKFKGRLLGLYQGIPLNKRGAFYTNVLPDKITLFKDEIEKLSIREENLLRVIKEVLIHEIGHHFGLSEKEIAETQ